MAGSAGGSVRVLIHDHHLAQGEGGREGIEPGVSNAMLTVGCRHDFTHRGVRSTTFSAAATTHSAANACNQIEDPKK